MDPTQYVRDSTARVALQSQHVKIDAQGVVTMANKLVGSISMQKVYHIIKMELLMKVCNLLLGK